MNNLMIMNISIKDDKLSTYAVYQSMIMENGELMFSLQEIQLTEQSKNMSWFFVIAPHHFQNG